MLPANELDVLRLCHSLVPHNFTQQKIRGIPKHCGAEHVIEQLFLKRQWRNINAITFKIAFYKPF
jgi:hypothetical protein